MVTKSKGVSTKARAVKAKLVMLEESAVAYLESLSAMGDRGGDIDAEFNAEEDLREAAVAYAKERAK